jgi:hypothetical protein
MKALEVELWSSHFTKAVRRSRPMRRAEERLGARRPTIATRADVRALVRAIEASREEVAA